MADASDEPCPTSTQQEVWQSWRRAEGLHTSQLVPAFYGVNSPIACSESGRAPRRPAFSLCIHDARRTHRYLYRMASGLHSTYAGWL